MTDAPILKSVETKATIASFATAFGLDPAVAGPAVASLTTALSQRIERNTISRGGVADMVGLLVDPASGRAMTETKALNGADIADTGNHILDVLIGNKHISRGIAARTAADTGIDEETAKKMLPVVASMMLGGLQKQAAARNVEIVPRRTGARRCQQRQPVAYTGRQYSRRWPQRAARTTRHSRRCSRFGRR